MRMDNGKLTQRILKYVRKNKNDIRWAQRIKDIREMGITKGTVQDRTTSREVSQNFKGFQEEDEKKRNNVWTEERRKI